MKPIKFLFITIIFSFSFITTSNLFGAEDSQKKISNPNFSDWIPLQPNNVWVFNTYENRYSPYGPSVVVFFKTSKMYYSKDTVVNNKTWSVIYHDVFSAMTNHINNPLILRFDNSTGKYYTLIGNQEKLFFDPTADSGTVIQDYFVLGKKEYSVIFGDVREVWNVNPIVGGYGNLKFVKGIGLYFSVFDEYGGFIDTLKGCVINNQVYGDTSFVTSVDDKIIPKDFKLYQNFPNPFNAQTIIQFDLPEKQNVELKIYNSIGKEILSFNLGELEIGNHKIRIDGSKLSSGMYFYKLITQKYTAIKKMVYIK